MKQLNVLPAGFLNTLSEKTRLELKNAASTYKFREYINHYDYYNIYESSNHLPPQAQRPNKPLITNSAGGIVLIEHNGFVLLDDNKASDSELAKLMELYEKARELDELKASLDKIKKVLT